MTGSFSCGLDSVLRFRQRSGIDSGVDSGPEPPVEQAFERVECVGEAPTRSGRFFREHGDESVGRLALQRLQPLSCVVASRFVRGTGQK